MRAHVLAILTLLAAPLASADPVCLPDDIRCAPVDLGEHNVAYEQGTVRVEGGSYTDPWSFHGTALHARAGNASIVYEQGAYRGDSYTLIQVFAAPQLWLVSYYHNDDSGSYGQGFSCTGFAGNVDGGLASRCMWLAYPAPVQSVLRALP